MSNYKHQSVVGTLTLVPHGSPDGGDGFFFEKEDGSFLSLKFSGGRADSSTVPLNEKVAMCMSAVEVDGFNVVCTHKPFFTKVAQPMMLEASNGKVKKHIGVFRQMPLNTTEEAQAKQLKKTQSQAKSIQDYYRHYGHNIWDVEVRGYVMLGEENAYPPYYAKNDINKFMADNDMEGFEPNYFHVNGGYHKSYCGQGNKPGNRSVTYIHYACGVKTMVHEIGHNLGLHHASTLNTETDKLVEYGDQTSVMGSSQRLPGFNSVNVVQLGFEDEREIKRVSTTQQILICPLEMTKHGMHENEYQNVVIEAASKTFHLSIRKIKGVQYHSSVRDPSALFIHEATRDKHSILVDGMMRYPGASRIIYNNIKIEYLEYENETARVNIIYGDDDAPDDIPMPTGFPESLPAVSIGTEHNGAWYNPDYTGEGLDLHVKGDKMVLYWYTYNVKQTSRRFYLATCSLEEGLNEFDILTTEDGTWDDPTLHTSKVVGKGQLYFFDGTRGVFNWNTEEHGRGSIEVTPVALSGENPHPSNGSYYQPSRNGEGFTIQFFEHLDSVAAFWFSYGPTVKGGPYDRYTGNMKQRWYVCSGKRSEDGTYDLTVYEATNNKWMYVRDNPGTDEVGTAKLTITDVNNIVFDFDIDADQVTDKGTYDLQRLF